MAQTIRETIFSTGRFAYKDGKIHQVDLVAYKGVVWIHRFDHLGEASSTYIVKRRSRYVRTKDWLISYWMVDTLYFALTLLSLALVPLWVLLAILGL